MLLCTLLYHLPCPLVIDFCDFRSITNWIYLTGTAGLWRISALNEAGGWKDRTTVEDMDLAVRASLKGWKFVFLGDLKVLSISMVKNMQASALESFLTQHYYTTKQTSRYSVDSYFWQILYLIVMPELHSRA